MTTRFIALAVFSALSFPASGMAQDDRDAAYRALAAVLPPGLAQQLGDNSCQYAFDSVCDDPTYGSQAFCAPGTDAADCRAVLIGGEDSCQWARDGECDEPRADGALFACAIGTDLTDCGPPPGAPSGTAQSTTGGNGLPIPTPQPGGPGQSLQSLVDLIPTPAGDDSCDFANDLECDEPRYGGAACLDGTDATDCRILASGSGDDSCATANDGLCNEPRTGDGTCLDGSDTSDCAALAALRDADYAQLLAALPISLQNQLGTNTCAYAWDMECDDSAFGGSGACASGTDGGDCRALAAGGDDSCTFAQDNECDEARFDGTGACTDGTDTTDCAAQTTADTDALQALLDAVPADIRGQLGDDTCEYAGDLECDDVNFGGTGACDPGTDAGDCRALAIGGDNTCQYADDNECDEPSIGTGACASGTDSRDCSTMAFMRNRDDACDAAFDGVCNEPGLGDGTCQLYSDTADCVGRGRPAGMEYHFFGRDDRFLPDVEQMPWRAMGLLEFENHTCSGTLVGARTVLTAAHCVTDDGIKTEVPLTFSAGAMRGGDMGTARGVSAIFAPGYSTETKNPGQGNGDDWAIVTIDRDLGKQVGTLGIHVLNDADLAEIRRNGLIVSQGGYSSDTGGNLSANTGCRLTEAFEDGSVLHECDTVRGDSGSAFVLQIDGVWQIVAVDSQFFEPESKNSAFQNGNLAVDSRAFADAVAQSLAQQ